MRVAVVGAGLGGLLVAAEAVRRGFEVLVLDAAPGPGGVATTVVEDGYLLEPAVGSFPLPHPHLGPLLEAAGVPVTVRPGSSARHVSGGGRFTALPSDPKGALTWPGLPVTARLRALAEVAVAGKPDESETLDEFLARRFGDRAGSLAAGLLAGGVFAGDPSVLEASSAFGRLTALESSAGSILRGALRARPSGPRPLGQVPVGGMLDLARHVADFVGEVRYDTPVEIVVPAGAGWVVDGESVDRVVLAVDPTAAGAILGIAPGRTVPTVQVAVVGLGGPSDRMGDVEGFGGLTTRHAGLATLGVIFEAGPGRAPEGHRLLRAIVGGARGPAVAAEPDADLLERVVGEVGRLMGGVVEPTWSRVVRRSIPQYTVGHRAWVDHFGARLPAGVAVAGWWYRGIGMASLASDAVGVVERLADH